MSDFVKADGARILIVFDKPLIGTVTDQQSHFKVMVHEYTMVPGGVIQDVVKEVNSTEAGELENQLILNMEPLQRFESAVGRITIEYDGEGTLMGVGGPVVAFSASFSPTGLIPKDNPNDMEHISISVSASGRLTKVTYSDTSENEHIKISVTAVGVLTHINDI